MGRAQGKLTGIATANFDALGGSRSRADARAERARERVAALSHASPEERLAALPSMLAAGVPGALKLAIEAYATALERALQRAAADREDDGALDRLQDAIVRFLIRELDANATRLRSRAHQQLFGSPAAQAMPAEEIARELGPALRASAFAALPERGSDDAAASARRWADAHTRIALARELDRRIGDYGSAQMLCRLLRGELLEAARARGLANDNWERPLTLWLDSAELDPAELGRLLLEQ